MATTNELTQNLKGTGKWSKVPGVRIPDWSSSKTETCGYPQLVTEHPRTGRLSNACAQERKAGRFWTSVTRTGINASSRAEEHIRQALWRRTWLVRRVHLCSRSICVTKTLQALYRIPKATGQWHSHFTREEGEATETGYPLTPSPSRPSSVGGQYLLFTIALSLSTSLPSWGSARTTQLRLSPPLGTVLTVPNFPDMCKK